MSDEDGLPTATPIGMTENGVRFDAGEVKPPSALKGQREDILATANRLIEMIEADTEAHTYWMSADGIRDIARRILEAANVSDLGGYPLCQG